MKEERLKSQSNSVKGVTTVYFRGWPKKKKKTKKNKNLNLGKKTQFSARFKSCQSKEGGRFQVGVGYHFCRKNRGRSSRMMWGSLKEGE